jgi:hypothetical protein
MTMHDDALVITSITRRQAAAGTWVDGRVGEFRFQALVFQGHADSPEWEIGRSRISKLWVQRMADQQTAFNWDRGADVPARDAPVQAVVDFLVATLAERIYPDATGPDNAPISKGRRGRRR